MPTPSPFTPPAHPGRASAADAGLSARCYDVSSHTLGAGWSNQSALIFHPYPEVNPMESQDISSAFMDNDLEEATVVGGVGFWSAAGIAVVLSSPVFAAVIVAWRLLS